jgi:hypothetical protein
MTVVTVEQPALRGKALARWRRNAAVSLAAAGHGYDQIAAMVGYANRGTAWRVVQEALRDRVVEQVDELRELERHRLDSLQAAFWEPAMRGDAKAADRVLKIMAQRSRLLGLEVQRPKPLERQEEGRIYFILQGRGRLDNLRFNAIYQAEVNGAKVTPAMYAEAGLEPGEATRIAGDQIAW